MSTSLKLNIEEVCSLLGLSNDSIIKHIDKGTLTAGKLKNNDEEIFVFDFVEVKNFATEYLDMTIEMPENPELKEAEKKVKKTQVKKKENTKEENKQVSSLLDKLHTGYTAVLKQLADYKEQAAFKIGQLEGELSSQRKLLSDGQHEIVEKDKMIRKLKIELKKTRVDLNKEKNMLDKMSLWQRIWKKKEY